jgi:hypothetical protein
MRAMRLGTCLLAALAAGVALAGGSARGFSVDGRPWPGGTITYYNAAPDQAWAVETAVAAWNASGARVRFVPASAARAQVRIEHFTNASCTVNTEATVGNVPNARMFVFRLDQRSPYCNAFVAVQMVAHELGHVLGLGHELGVCAAMNPATSQRGPTLCPQAAPWQWRCRLLAPDDVAGAIQLYGGTARPPHGPRDCDLYAAGRPPAQLRLAPTGVPGEAHLSFRRPPSVGIPVLLATQHEQPEAFAVTVAAGRCMTDASGAPRHLWNVQPGELEQLPLGVSPGLQCTSVWAIDAFGRPSARPATLWARS